MKEEMNRKESRWAAAQARTRTEMKILKDHNSTLQKEMNDLKKVKKKVTTKLLAPTFGLVRRSNDYLL